MGAGGRVTLLPCRCVKTCRSGSDASLRQSPIIRGAPQAAPVLASQGRPVSAASGKGGYEGGRAEARSDADLTSKRPLASGDWATSAASFGERRAAPMSPRTVGYVSLSDHPVPPQAPRHSPQPRQQSLHASGGSMQAGGSVQRSQERESGASPSFSRAERLVARSAVIM